MALMRATLMYGAGDVRVENVPDSQIREPTDAIVRLTASAICGTDLHMIRGTLPGMKAGTLSVIVSTRRRCGSSLSAWR